MTNTVWGAETVERLRVKLTKDEIVTRAEALARHMAESVRIEDDFAAARKAHAETMKERERHEHARAQDIALGSEEREVTCIEVPRFSDRLVDIVRRDTREVVRTRAMQPDERQADLFADEPELSSPSGEPSTKH